LTHELRTAAGLSVSDQKIRNRLRSRNLRPRRPAVTHPLTRCHRRLCLYRCRRHFTAQHVSGSLFAFRTNHDSI